MTERDSSILDPRSATNRASLADLLAEKLPDEHGRYGPFGGRFVPEILISAVSRLEAEVKRAFVDPEFLGTLNRELADWVGRPTALTKAKALGKQWGARIFLKREDLAHTGAHKINNAIGQALLARKMGAKRVVAETGAGQHGVATAAACARIGMPCTVYMGAVDAERQRPNVQRIQQLGAEIIKVTTGDRTLRAAIDEAIRAWVADPESTYYIIGSAVGPHPYPLLVRRLQSIIGREAREQMLSLAGKLPDVAIACVGGGSNAIGLFHSFLADNEVKLLGIEAGGSGDRTGEHAATMRRGSPGVLHGSLSFLLHDDGGQIQDTHSISAGLDYPGIGPEHAFLSSVGRVVYDVATDREALDAFKECASFEGILPALESAHALAGAKKYASLKPDTTILVGLSGRGDKDLGILLDLEGGNSND